MEDYIEELLQSKELSDDVGEILDNYASMLIEVERWCSYPPQPGCGQSV